jgi:hypothetical protein
MTTMTGSLNRRNLLIGGLWTGVALATPMRLLAHAHKTSTAHGAGQAGASHLMQAGPGFESMAPSASMPATASPLTPYERQVVTIAQQQISRLSGVIWKRDLVAVADFARPSNLPRLHFVNVENGTLRSELVAHGRGSDPQHDGWLKHFSNTVNSEATSRGAYLTASIYDGKYGPSIRLRGLDADNSNALERAIVMHPAWYAAPDMLTKYGKLGRSEGCFAMDPQQFNKALTHLAAGRLLYADRISEA